ncbi:MAG: methylenetetrahydrofolate reductase [NAD(P)H] [Microscillaceae bacterium]|nr:methylenetetrahydrofolate reductase [NAD(P)H] [Microscillaceae bacterium]MDW8461096.1 methylenetetrahydrofolate reductase [NAD(P)H] [Cytophagales bacterium]
MKITEHIAKAKKTLFSFEILPPLKGESIQTLFKAIEPLMEFKPAFIDVTYHREEYVYKQHPNGLLEKRTIRKRPGTVGICAAIMNHFKVDAVPHLICGGFDKEETENALIDLNYLGIDNVLVLRGDSIKSETSFIPEPNGHAYASELLEQVVNMNKGIFLDTEMTKAQPTNFCIGVAGYPEKHFEAPNLQTDLKYLKKKVDMGADYIVTQMFFDNKKFFEFVRLCREMGIDVPIIPGLKPITTKKQLTTLPSIFHIDLPQELVEAVEACKDNAQVKQVGIEWGIQQSKELIEFGVPCLHYYSMSKSDAVQSIAAALF